MRIVFALALLLFACTPAHAQDADLQHQLVRAAGDIRTIERRLHTLETHLDDLNTRRAGLEKEYQAQRSKMATTLAALTRMGRTPREAVLVRPGGPLQAARSTMLLSASLPAIESEAAAFRTLLTDLERTRSVLAEKTEAARNARRDLAARHAKLSALMDARVQRGGIASLEETRAVQALAREARSLRDLLSSLQQDKPGDASDVPDTSLALVDEGEGQLPVSGIIRVRYGDTDKSTGLRSEGLSIETISGAVVVAPLGGIVRYAGPFRGYGNIVIIAHKGGYHSLVAGLDKINVSAGQMIVSGEPIAILDDDKTTNQAAARRTVYYELRRAGAPVNPSRKLPDFG